MPFRPLRHVAAFCLAIIGLRWIVNTNPWSGPTILRLADGHGVHLNDWVSFVCWGAAALLVWPQLATTEVRAMPAALRRSGRS